MLRFFKKQKKLNNNNTRGSADPHLSRTSAQFAGVYLYSVHLYFRNLANVRVYFSSG